MQDGRREAIHNPPQGKATQGGEQHGYQPSEKWTNPTTRAYEGRVEGGGAWGWGRKRGGNKMEGDKKTSRLETESFQSSAFPHRETG